MFETLTTSEIAQRLRADENANWSYFGSVALAEWLEQMEEDAGEPMEFDRVAIRCEYSEYGSALEAAGNYDFTPANDELEPDEAEADALEWLQERTWVIEFVGGVIIQDF